MKPDGILLCDAINKIKTEKPEISLIQKLILGELHAEGRLLSETMTEDEMSKESFSAISRQFWATYNPNIQENRLVGNLESAFADGSGSFQEQYVDIYIKGFEKTANSGGRPKVVNREKLNADIATYFIVTPQREQVLPYDDKEKFIKEMIEKLPYIDEIYINGESSVDQTKTIKRALNEFLNYFNSAVKSFDQREGET